MKVQRVLPGLGLGIAILVLGPLRTQYRFEYQAAGLLGLAILSGIWLAIVYRRGGRIAPSPIDVPLFALVIAFTIASAASLDPRRSLGQVQLLLGHVLLFWVVFDLLSREEPQNSSPKPQVPISLKPASANWKPPGRSRPGTVGHTRPPPYPGGPKGLLEAWVTGLLAVSGVVLLLGVAEVETWYLSWWKLGGAAHPWPPFSYRLTSWLGHANGFSALIAACVPLAAVALLRSQRAPVRIALGLWLMGALVGLVFASSRAGWLAMGGGLALLAVLCALERPGAMGEMSAARAAGLESDLGAQGPPRTGAGRRRTAGWLLAVGCAVALAGIGWLALRTFRDPTHEPILLSRAELWPPAWQAFLSSPWTGTGPATFFRHFLAANPLSQHTFLVPAHSVFFSLLAEEGLVGTAAAGLVILAGLLAAVRSLRASPPADRLWRMGALGGLAALVVPALTDNAATTPPVSLVLVVLAAISLSGRGEGHRTRPAWGPSLVLLLLLSYGALTLPGQLAFQRGLQRARSGDPLGAALAFDEAGRNDPRFAWYSLQAGFAHGLVAGEDPSQLAFAVEAYETGIREEPAYSVHPLNLAWLYWQAGLQDIAVAEVSRAAEADPTSPLILLNQAWMLESSRDLQAARRQYAVALDADAQQADTGYATPHGSIPDLAHSLFWESNSFRRQILAGWSSRAEPSAYTSALEIGFRHLAGGDLQAAREGFQRARRLDPFRPEAFRGLGLTEVRAGEPDEARYYLQAAGLARGSAFQRMLAWLDLMELEAGAGRNPEAVQAGLRGFAVLEAYNSWGMGSDHANPYAWGVFYRETLPDDLLPSVLRPDMSADLADRLLVLAGLFDSAGNRADACRVVGRVLHAAPEYDPAVTESELFSCLS